jgi:hypothetical protein
MATRMNVEGDQERGARAPGVVDLDVADTGLGAPQCEMPGEVPRLVGRAVAGGEYEPGLLPVVASPSPIGGLALGAQLERGHADVGQGRNASASGVLVSRWSSSPRER